MELRAADIMSTPVFTARPDDSLRHCCHLMEDHQVRRVPVVDEQGCCGIVSQADIARQASPDATAEVVRDISEPTGAAAGAR